MSGVRAYSLLSYENDNPILRTRPKNLFAVEQASGSIWVREVGRRVLDLRSVEVRKNIIQVLSLFLAQPSTKDVHLQGSKYANMLCSFRSQVL